MGKAAHAGTARRPEADEVVPGGRNGQSRIAGHGLTRDQPFAAVIGRQPSVVGAGVSGDGEGAPEFPSALAFGCISAPAFQPMASISARCW